MNKCKEDMNRTKHKKKVIPHCYRRNLSRTLSNSSISQLIQIGSYKKRINDLSRNNRKLASALQEARLEAADQINLLQDCAKDCNKILYARLKLNEMAKNLAKFVTDLEEVRSYLNVDLLADHHNPFAKRKGASNGRIGKEPAVNCIEEVTEDSSDDAAVTENSPTAPEVPNLNSNDKEPSVLPINPENISNLINEDIEMAPILFADDSEGKKKKSSNRSRSSKVSNDADKGSLTPELNIDLTSVKLKRKSSRRQTQFVFPGSRSTSRGKAERENSPEELVTPPKPPSPIFTHQDEEVAEMQKTNEEISASPITNNVVEKEEQCNFLENHPKPVLNTTECDHPNVSVINPAKNFKPVVVPGESNHTVLLCEDMELTDVIRPVHQIIVENTSFPAFNSLENSNLNCDTIKKTNRKRNDVDLELISEKDSVVETNEDDVYKKIISKKNSLFETKGDDIYKELVSKKNSLVETKGDDIYKGLVSEKPSLVETKRDNINKVFFSETDSSDLFESYPSERNDDDNKQVLEINENDEVQNVGMITFCETNNDDDEIISNRSTKSSLINHNRRAKPVKYAVFFSSDESEEESPFEISANKRKNSKRQTVILAKTGKSCEKNENAVGHRKISSEESKLIKNDDLSLPYSEIDAKLGKKSSKKSKDSKNSCKKDLPKQSIKKSLTVSKDKPSKPDENVMKLMFSPCASPGILKKKLFDIENTKKIDKEAPSTKIKYKDNLDETIESVVGTPKSGLRKVSFAPTDLVCNFRRMSESKKIAENKKVRRASKSFLDLEELFEGEEAETKTSHRGADNFSESTDVRKEDDDKVFFNFSGETELYIFPLPSKDDLSSAVPPSKNNISSAVPPSKNNISSVVPLSKKNNFSSAVPVDDLSSNPAAPLNAIHKNVNKHLKKVVSSKPVKSSGKLSLKKNKDLKNADLPHVSGEIRKEVSIPLFESPVSVCKPAKRKSLFKEHIGDEAKENIHLDQLVLEEPKIVSHEKDKADANKDLVLPDQENCVKKKSKGHSKVNGKVSTKKLSDKVKLLEPTPEMKKKKHSMAVKCIENSPVLKDTVNLPDVQDGNFVTKRRSKQISYKEPPLNKKMRRE